MEGLEPGRSATSNGASGTSRSAHDPSEPEWKARRAATDSLPGLLIPTISRSAAAARSSGWPSSIPGCVFHWVVFSAIGVREAEATARRYVVRRSDRLKGPLLKTFRDGFMPFVGAEVKAVFEDAEASCLAGSDFHSQPERCASGPPADRGIDLEHLSGSFDPGVRDSEIRWRPGTAERVRAARAEVCQKKVRYIMDAFQSQHAKRWFRGETFLSLMRLRGMECNAPSGYAEAFYCRKLVL